MLLEEELVVLVVVEGEVVVLVEVEVVEGVEVGGAVTSILKL